MAFSNPIVGGVTLIRPAIQSPDFQTGVQGWSINKDGTAEFNGVTVRGAIVETSANGNRIVIHSTTRGAQTVGEILFYTEVSTDDPGSVTALGPADGAQRALQLTAPHANGAPTAPTLTLTYEATPATRCDIVANTTYVEDVHATGSVTVTGAITKASETWQTPGAAYLANWAGGSPAAARYKPLQFRRDAEDNLHICGAFTSTVARAAGAYTIFQLSSPYIPTDLYAGPAIQTSAADAWKSAIRFNVDSAGPGSVGISTPVAIAANDAFYVNLVVPLGNIT